MTSPDLNEIARCRACESPNLNLVYGKRPGELVETSNHVLMKCVDCGDTCAVPKRLIPSLQAVGERRGVIQTDSFCPYCKYNLRGLSANGKCPECGQSIQTMRFASVGPRVERIRLWRRLKWAYISGFILLVVMFAAFRSQRRIEPFLLFLAIGAVSYGIEGILSGRISLSPKAGFPVLTGIWCKICGATYIALGAVVGSLAALRWLGLI